MSRDAAPALYTVEEAARVLRIGRTKAYAMTQEWRATGGQSGLPVVAFGSVLRVPRAALERLLGVDLAGAGPPAADAPVKAAPGRAADQAAAAQANPQAPASPDSTSRPHTAQPDPCAQLDLFDAAG